LTSKPLFKQHVQISVYGNWQWHWQRYKQAQFRAEYTGLLADSFVVSLARWQH